MTHAPGKNTLKLTSSELDRLLNRYDVGEEGTPTNIKRTFRRFQFRRESVVLEVIHPGGSSTKIAVAGRNLSVGGLCVLHSCYVHVGSKCVVWLPHPDLKWVRVPGEVRRCAHLEGRVHEIGIAFDKELPARDLLRMDAMSGSYTLEHTDPAKIEGTLLVVDNDTMQHELVRTLLAETSLHVRFASDVDGALSLAGTSDLLLSEHDLGHGQTVCDLLDRLLEKRIRVPVVILSTEKSPAALEALRDAGAVGFVGKPLVRERLLSALAEFMTGLGAQAAIYSMLPDDDPAAVLVRRFVHALPESIADVRAAIKSKDRRACLEQVRLLLAQGASLGFPQLGRAAEAVSRKLESGAQTDDARAELRALLALCQRINCRPAA